MEENKLSFNELEDLMPKIKEAMEQSKQKEEEIKNSETSLKEETRLGYYEEGKNKIEEMKAQKDEFDDMTKPTLNRAKLSIDKLKEEAIKDNNDKILLIYNKKQEAKRKHDSMVSKASSPEAVERIEVAYNKALERITDEEGRYKTSDEDTMGKLNEWDSYIVDSLHELGMPIPTENKKEPQETEPEKHEQVTQGEETQIDTKEQIQQEEETRKEETSQENEKAIIEQEDGETKKVDVIEKNIQEKLSKEVQSMTADQKDKENFQAQAEIKEEEKQIVEKKQGIFSRLKNWFKDKISKIMSKKKEIAPVSSDTKNGKRDMKEELKVEGFEEACKETAQQTAKEQEVSKEDEGR